MQTYAVNHNNPIQMNDPLGDSANDPKTYKVKKGDNLTNISKRVGVSVDDLVKMNKLKDRNKLSIGQILKVNPEVDFKDNPHGGYSNPNNAEGTEVSIDGPFATLAVGAAFPYGIGPENQLITTGKVMDNLRAWEQVSKLTGEGTRELWKDGKLTPGETFLRSYGSPNIPRWTYNQFSQYLPSWLLNSPQENHSDEKFFSPQHVIGSFNLSMRVNADGYTVTICVYDAKTISSMSDGILGKSANSKNTNKKGRTPFSTQYQRFIWDVSISR